MIAWVRMGLCGWGGLDSTCVFACLCGCGCGCDCLRLCGCDCKGVCGCDCVGEDGCVGGQP